LVVSEIADNARFKQVEFNAAFVLVEYFSYLRRDADAGGFEFWLTVLNREPGNYRAMVCRSLRRPSIRIGSVWLSRTRTESVTNVLSLKFVDKASGALARPLGRALLFTA
jgi:hypothetical protein